MNKYLGYILLICLLLSGSTTYAAESPVIMETYTGDSEIAIYVKGSEGGAGGATVQIGTTVCEDVTSFRLAESGQPMQTLVMIDNSLSIPEGERESIAQILQNLISDRDEKEEIAIATFDEDIKYLSDYSSDYATLKSAIDSVEYQDLETYLTDVLYELLSKEYVEAQKDVYRRIIVISDGVDNKSIGYTKDELYALLKEYNIPIYAVGVENGKNDEQLENMFALTRMTKAEGFLLNNMDNILDINTALDQDRNIEKYVIHPDAETMDGSRKVVKIECGSGQSLSTEVTMPQQEKVSMPQEPQKTQEPQKEEQPIQENTEENSINIAIILIIAVCLIAIVAAIVVVIIYIVRRNKNKNSFEAIKDDTLLQMNSTKCDDDGKTELVGSFSKPSDDGATFLMWNTETSYDIILTDIHSPVKSFQAPLRSNVIIGRKKDMCGIALDYDKSVSSRHCEIKVRDGKFYINDLQSSNGTYVNGCKVLTEIEIFSGNIIKMGRLELRFEVK